MVAKKEEKVVDIVRAKDLAAMAVEASRLVNLIHEGTKQLEFNDPAFDKAVLNAADVCADIRESLKELTDGRPKPFSIMDDYSYQVTYAKSDEEREEAFRAISKFGLVGSRCAKYPDEPAAGIGGYGMKLETLVEFRDWINSVIEWHQAT